MGVGRGGTNHRSDGMGYDAAVASKTKHPRAAPPKASTTQKTPPPVKKPAKAALGPRAAAKPASSKASAAKPARAAGAGRAKAPAKASAVEADGSRLVEERIRAVGGWRGETLAEVRRLVRAAEPEIVEDCKWKKANNPLGTPVWSRGGIVCTGESYREVVKLTFARGAALADPKRLFNASLEGNARRAIDLREGQPLDGKAFQALVRAAVAENLRASGKAGAATKARSGGAEATVGASSAASTSGKAGLRARR